MLDGSKNTFTLSGVSRVLDTVTLTDASVEVNGENTTTTASAVSAGGADVTDDVTWSVSPDNGGVSIDSTGAISISGKAVEQTYTVTATGTNGVAGSKSTTLTVTRVTSVVTSVTVSGDTTIAVPTAAVGSVSTSAFTATVKDQYGDTMSGQTVTWSIPQTTGVSIDSGTGVVSVTNEASTGSVTVTATCAEKTGEATLSITKSATELASFAVNLDNNEVYVPTAGSEKDATITVSTQDGTDQYGDSYTPQNVTYSLEGTYTGITLSGSTITVTKDAINNTFEDNMLTVTVNATAGSVKAKEVTFTLKREASVPTTVTINGSAAATDTIGIPNSGSTTKTYSAVVKDQYGIEMTSPGVTWTTEGTLPDGITVADNGEVTVSSEAVDNASVTLKATCGDASATVAVTAKTVDVNWNAITLRDGGITYGDSCRSAFQTLPTNGTATAYGGGSSTTLNGTFTILTEGYLDAGTGKTITVQFMVTDAGDYANATFTKNFTVNVAQKKVDLSWINTNTRIYDGTPSNVTATATGLVGEDTCTVTVTGGTEKTAGTHTATATEVSNPNYKLPSTNFTQDYTINKATLTLSDGDYAITKVYDGTTAADTASGALGLTGVVEGDAVAVSVGSAAYADKNVGTNKTVNLSDLTLSGDDADNYTLAKDSYAFSGGEITAKEVTVSGGITANNKTYDGATDASLDTSAAVIAGKADSDNLTVTATGTFADKNAGNSKEVSISNIALTGTDARNYTLANSDNQATTTANITAKELTVNNGTVVVTKEYDGTTNAGTLTGALGLDGVVDGDTVSINMDDVTVGAYPSANYGTYSVALSGIALTGGDADNYTVPTTYTFTGAKITKTVPKLDNLNVESLPSSKTYDKNPIDKVNVTPADGVEGLGAITVLYQKGDETPSTALPVNAGTYTVIARIAASANFEAADITLNGNITINKADRKLAVDPTSLTLYPIEPTTTLKLTYDNLDNSAVPTFNSDNTKAVTVNNSGKVTAVANGIATITVSIPETSNYLAATDVTVTVKAVAEPLLGVTVSGGADDKVTATVKDGKIIVSGMKAEESELTVSPTLANSDDTGVTLTSTVADGKLTVKQGDTEIATYPIDTQNVTVVPTNIEIPEETANVSIPDEISDQVSAVNSDATKTEGLNESAAKVLVDAAQAVETAKKDEITNSITGSYKLVATVETVIKPTALTTSGTETKLTLDITPVYEIKAVADTATDQDATGATGTLETKEIKTLPTPIKISVKLPSVFDDLTTLFAKHTHNNKTEWLRATIENGVASWFQSTFSEVELIADTREANNLSFQFRDGSTQTVSLSPSDIGTTLPGNGEWNFYTESDGTKTQLGVQAKYSSLTDELLTALSDAQKDGATIVVEQASAPSGGGSTAPSVTVPVSGDGNSLSVSATVSGTTATVKEIKDADLAKVTGGEDVVIDLTGLNKSIDTVKLPTATVDKIGEQGGMNVKLSTGAVTFDAEATQAISEQASGKNIELVVKSVKETSLNASQKEAVETLDTACIVDVYLVSDGKTLCSADKGGFDGGKATVTLPYEIKDGHAPEDFIVYYVSDTGKLEVMNAKYDTQLGAFVFDVTHFSNYVVAYLTVPAYNVCPKDVTCPIEKFTDTKNDAWYHDGVHYCLENGMMNGTGAATFNPDGNVTRGQLVTILWRAEGQPDASSAGFADVAPGQYYEVAVNWAAANGIVNGMGDNQFAPNTSITREQFAAILARYAAFKGVDTEATSADTNILSFNDATSVSEYAVSAMQYCVGTGIINGDNNNLMPQGNATRAQAATMLMRFMENNLK